MPKNTVDKDTGLVKSPFTISSSSTGVDWMKSSGSTADLVSSALWTEIMKYSVPLGMAVEITPVNFFFGYYLATDASTAITAGETRILKQNANGTESREIWSGTNKLFKDIGDEFQRPKLRVPALLNASQVLKVEVRSLGTTLDTTSNFYVECMQYYEEV